MQTNVVFAWCWILCGLLSGSVIGLFFHQPGWLGGYDSWQRRMIRLGHISFLGTGGLNLGYGLSLAAYDLPGSPRTGAEFIVGAVTMPLICFLAAWNDRCRHLFFIPVASLVLATAEFLWSSVCK